MTFSISWNHKRPSKEIFLYKFHYNKNDLSRQPTRREKSQKLARKLFPMIGQWKSDSCPIGRQERSSRRFYATVGKKAFSRQLETVWCELNFCNFRFFPTISPKQPNALAVFVKTVCKWKPLFLPTVWQKIGYLKTSHTTIIVFLEKLTK